MTEAIKRPTPGASAANDACPTCGRNYYSSLSWSACKRGYGSDVMFAAICHPEWLPHIHPECLPPQYRRKSSAMSDAEIVELNAGLPNVRLNLCGPFPSGDVCLRGARWGHCGRPTEIVQDPRWWWRNGWREEQ